MFNDILFQRLTVSIITFFLSLQAQQAKFFKSDNLIGAGYPLKKICSNALVCKDVMNCELM